jgi:transcription termination factor NusB
MHPNEQKKKILSLGSKKLEELKQNSEFSKKAYFPTYDKKAIHYFPERDCLDSQASEENFEQPKKKFMFKKTFSRLICVQFFYEICFQIKILEKKPDSFDQKKLLETLESIIEIDYLEWSKFNRKKIMMNFIQSNISFYLKNFSFFEKLLEEALPKESLVKNQINDAILLSAFVEFVIFNQKLNSESESHQLEELELQSFCVSEEKSNHEKIIDQKKILINEYIDVVVEFSDDFFVKYINGILESVFSNFPEKINIEIGAQDQ